MRLLELAGRHPFVAASLIGATLGVVVGLFLPIRAAQPPSAGDDGWLFSAKGVQRHDPGIHVALRNATFWGATAAASREKPVEWMLNAILTRPVLRAVVTAKAKQSTTTQVALGGTLPDGSVLVAANRDAIWFEKDGCKRKRTLFQPVPKDEACIGAAPAGSAPAPASTAAKPQPLPPASPPPAPTAPATNRGLSGG